MSSFLPLRQLSESAAGPSITGLLSSVGGNAFRSKLQKHLSDHRAGEGHLSRSLYATVESRRTQTATLLQGDPHSARLYSGYLTAGLSYDKQAMFVTGIRDAVITASIITKA